MEKSLDLSFASIAAVTTLKRSPPEWAQLGPDTALLILTLGLLLVYLECNRPGAVLPGAIGVGLVLVAVAALARLHPAAPGVALVVTATALLFLDLVWPTPALVSVAATVALVSGFAVLLSGSPVARVQPVTAVGCGLLLGTGTSLLTRIARRARANKGLD